MPRKPNPKLTEAEQSKRFLETAKAFDVEKTGEMFKRALDAVVPAAKSTRKAKRP